MPYQRKPPQGTSGRADGPTLPADSSDFSIESTTMRLKSMRVRRAENEKAEAERVAAENEDTAKLKNDRPSGRVRHDARGMAVWDWAVATGEFATLSATRAMKKLSIDHLKIEETSKAKTPELALEDSGRDKGGGFDPYNQSGSGKRQGEAAVRQGVTGAPGRERDAAIDKLLGKKK
jgi:hypothetical protein